MRLFGNSRAGCGYVSFFKKESAMKRVVSFLFIGVVFSTAAFADAGDEARFAFTIKNNALYIGKNPCVINAVTVPDLMQKADSLTELATALGHVAEVGGNVVCFDFEGLSSDGKSLDSNVAKRIDTLLEHISWRRLGSICRLFVEGAPADAGYREAAAGAVATALKSTQRIIVWIDGPASDAAIATFRKTAPNVLIASEQGGDIDVLKQAPSTAPTKQTLLVGSIPASELRDSLHFVLPAEEGSYAAMDAFKTDPAESKPWTPDNSMLSEEERKEGFVSLFDGKSLDGWWILGKKKDGYRVKDGAIEWNGEGGKGLYTHDRYQNFVLRFEWKINKNGNSGLYLHAPREGRQSKIGMEFQLQGDNGKPIDIHTTGAVYDVVAPKVSAVKPEGEWNNVEIVFNGPHLKALVNGQVVQDLNFDENEELRPRLRKGFIGLQDHACYVAFRNLRVKKLQ
jgi:hypothetical protein